MNWKHTEIASVVATPPLCESGVTSWLRFHMKNWSFLNACFHLACLNFTHWWIIACRGLRCLWFYSILIGCKTLWLVYDISYWEFNAWRWSKTEMLPFQSWCGQCKGVHHLPLVHYYFQLIFNDYIFYEFICELIPRFFPQTIRKFCTLHPEL